MKGRDEVKWILLCLQGQSNNGSSHGSRGRCPCVTVCAPVSQVCRDLRRRREERGGGRVREGGITGMMDEERGQGGGRRV